MSGIVPNSYQKPNFYADEFMHLLTGDEWKLLDYAVRRIMGFSRQQRRISFSQFEKGTLVNGVQVDHGTGCTPPEISKGLTLGLLRFGFLIPVPDEAISDPRANARGERGQCYELQLDASRIDRAGLEARAEEKRERGRKHIAKATLTSAERRRGGAVTAPETATSHVAVDEGETATSHVALSESASATCDVAKNEQTATCDVALCDGPTATCDVAATTTSHVAPYLMRKPERKPVTTHSSHEEDQPAHPPRAQGGPKVAKTELEEAGERVEDTLNNAPDWRSSEADVVALVRLCCVNPRRVRELDAQNWPDAIGTVRDALPDATPAERAKAIIEFGERWKAEGRSNPYLSQVTAHWHRLMDGTLESEKASTVALCCPLVWKHVRDRYGNGTRNVLDYDAMGVKRDRYTGEFTNVLPGVPVHSRRDVNGHAGHATGNTFGRGATREAEARKAESQNGGVGR